MSPLHSFQRSRWIQFQINSWYISQVKLSFAPYLLSSCSAKGKPRDWRNLSNVYLIVWKNMEKVFFWKIGCHQELGHEQKICVRAMKIQFFSTYLLGDLYQVLGSCSVWIICSPPPSFCIIELRKQVTSCHHLIHVQLIPQPLIVVV